MYFIFHAYFFRITHLELENTTESEVAFKIKTNAPTRYEKLEIIEIDITNEVNYLLFTFFGRFFPILCNNTVFL